MERLLQQSNLDPFLKTDTLTVLGVDEKKLEEKEKLNKSENCWEISWFRRIKILFEILKRPYDVGYFLTVCRLNKYRIIALLH